MAILPNLLETSSIGHIANTLNFGGLGKAWVITIIIVSIIFIVTFVWIFRGTKRRD